MLKNALGQGFRMVQHGMPWADIGEPADDSLRGRVLKEVFSDEFNGACHRCLREKGVLVSGRSEGSGGPYLV
jgi:hypothetical protein